MGPRSDDRGYGLRSPASISMFTKLQWVHGRMTVVMPPNLSDATEHGHASMGPRSDDRGYAQMLSVINFVRDASMGPRSDDRGYGQAGADCLSQPSRFNGSTVG